MKELYYLFIYTKWIHTWSLIVWMQTWLYRYLLILMYMHMVFCVISDFFLDLLKVLIVLWRIRSKKWKMTGIYHLHFGDSGLIPSIIWSLSTTRCEKQGRNWPWALWDVSKKVHKYGEQNWYYKDGPER